MRAAVQTGTMQCSNTKPQREVVCAEGGAHGPEGRKIGPLIKNAAQSGGTQAKGRGSCIFSRSVHDLNGLPRVPGFVHGGDSKDDEEKPYVMASEPARMGAGQIPDHILASSGWFRAAQLQPLRYAPRTERNMCCMVARLLLLLLLLLCLSLPPPLSIRPLAKFPRSRDAICHENRREMHHLPRCLSFEAVASCALTCSSFPVRRAFGKRLSASSLDHAFNVLARLIISSATSVKVCGGSRGDTRDASLSIGRCRWTSKFGCHSDRNLEVTTLVSKSYVASWVQYCVTSTYLSGPVVPGCAVPTQDRSHD